MQFAGTWLVVLNMIGTKKALTLAWTYFRGLMATIIGPELFHCRVRDGNGWDQFGIHTRVRAFFVGNLRFPPLMLPRFARTASPFPCYASGGKPALRSSRTRGFLGINIIELMEKFKNEMDIPKNNSFSTFSSKC